MRVNPFILIICNIGMLACGYSMAANKTARAIIAILTELKKYKDRTHLMESSINENGRAFAWVNEGLIQGPVGSFDPCTRLENWPDKEWHIEQMRKSQEDMQERIVRALNISPRPIPGRHWWQK